MMDHPQPRFSGAGFFAGLGLKFGIAALAVRAGLSFKHILLGQAETSSLC